MSPNPTAPRDLAIAPADYHHTYRHLAMREFAADIRIGLALAFFRTFAVPRIARLLLDTGETTERTRKRTDDTGLMMYELIAHGPDDPRGRRVIAALNRIHRVFGITDDEYRYVLGTFVFVPTRWIDRYSHRPLDDGEREATWQFYRRVGELMNIGELPTSWQAFEHEFDRFERDNFGYDPAATQLINATRTVLIERLPRVAKPFARPLVDALLDEPVRAALGLGRTNPVLDSVLRQALRLAARRRARTSVPDQDFFTPGQPSRFYPGGYTLDQLGPAVLRPVRRR